MKTKIFGLIIGLTLAIGSPITLLSLIDSYSSEVAQKPEVETSLKPTAYIELEFPAQDGNLRLLEINLKDLRGNSSSFKNYFQFNRQGSSQFCSFTISKNINRILFFINSDAIAASTVPLFISFRALII